MSSDENSFSGDDHDDSDRELQIAFQQGLLKPGLNVEVEDEVEHINDVDGLRASLSDLQNGLPWVERMDLTVAPIRPPAPLLDQLGENPDDLTGEAAHDDFKREMKFYRQAQAAVLEGLPRLVSLGLPTRRPEDYLAEMAKTDHHMKKVREKLLAKQIGLERSEKAKKLREMRKYGKKIQQEVLLKRQKEKKDMMDNMKKYRKGKTDKLDFLDEGKGNSGRQQQQQQQQSKNDMQANKKRQYKNSKYGYGGQKKRSKSNTADSSGEMGAYSRQKHSTAPGAPRVNKNKKSKRAKARLGKSRRQSAKSNKR